MPDDTSAPAVRVHDVRKSFGAQRVLEGVNLQVARGEAVAVLGRSGTGKSVLLKLVVGLEKPDAGSIEVLGKDVTRIPLRDLNVVRARIGFLFQDSALYDSMTVGENVAFPLTHGQIHSEGNGNSTADQKVSELLEFVGLKDAAAKMPGELSGGMKKRAALARALALDPDLLLCDEPTAALDPITTHEIETLLERLQRERHVATLVVTHDLQSARRIASRLAFMHEGTFVFDGPFDQLQKSTDPFVAEYLKLAS